MPEHISPFGTPDAPGPAPEGMRWYLGPIQRNEPRYVNESPARAALKVAARRAIERFIRASEPGRRGYGELESEFPIGAPQFESKADDADLAGNHRAAEVWRARAAKAAHWERAYSELQALWNAAGSWHWRRETDAELARELRAALTDIERRYKLDGGSSEVLRRLAEG